MKIVEHINKQDWDGAIAECTKIIDKYAKNGAFLSYVAYTYMHRGYARCFIPSKDDNYQEAIEDLSMAITLAPADKQKAECYVKRAYAYWIGGRYDSAIADCEVVIELAGSSFIDLVPRLYILFGKVAEAALMARDIANSKDPEKYQKIGEKANELKAEADQLVEDAETLKKTAQDAADKLGEAADKALNIVPCIVPAYELLGNIYSALDNPLEAIKHYKKALSLNSCSPSLLDNYRKARERLNRSR